MRMIKPNGKMMEMIAWDEGIPYSRAHFFSIRTTGGEAGLGQQITSFKALAVKIEFFSILGS